MWSWWSKNSKLPQMWLFLDLKFALVSKVWFNFFYTLRVHKLGKHVLTHIKIPTNILMGFIFGCKVSKFDVKLGVVVKIFKIRAGRWLFVFYSKNSLLQGVILNQFSTKQPQCPSGVQWKPLRRGAKRRVPQRDSVEQSPKGVQLFLLYILLV